MANDMTSTVPGATRERTSRLLGRYIVNHVFQFKFSLGLLAILAAATFILWMESSMAIRSVLRTGGVSDPGVIEQLRLLNTVIARSSVLITILSFGFALYMTHFIAGPIYRFERTFEELRTGNLGVQIRLRRRDEFQEAARLFNEGIVGVRQQLRQERDAVDAAVKDLSALADGLRAAGQTDASGRIEAVLTALRSAPGRLRL